MKIELIFDLELLLCIIHIIITNKSITVYIQSSNSTRTKS